ncbi:MAG: permease, partial [Candidatus Omnitrophica bacterium]|nr:permease [Candidatus Omnitrophota bacterium]
FGAFLEKYVKPNFVFRYLNKGFISIVNASILGAVLPGCACATMPMAEGLKKKGAGLGTLAAFVMVAPLLSPQTVILTYAMLGGKFTIARIIFSLSGAIILGVIFNFCEKTKIRGFALPALNCSGSECSMDVESQNLSFLKCFIGIITNLGRYFLLGLFIASLLMVLVPEDAIPRYIGSSGPFAYLVAALLGIPVYICEGEEIPLTVALLKLGLGNGPVFTFLLGSVGTCIPTMLMAQNVLGRRPVIFYIIGWFVFAIGSGLLFSRW